ncbi:MAG: glutamate formimidoyltransferase [Candidatus Eisenbacteria bacterium]|uniref:Formimidoyltransferase-cyclodeaminase n=1 Tax=Eiseniibacteriota bacterium TaxID=2212470 RepID=A0A7Y2E7U9_UNCEI|nr:glutamate formimidoyltransferase [Candidatus Eisenbacteria bacterium]
MAIVECVPNFSEGRNLAVINQITQAIENVEGVALLDVDPGAATNRTVVTFVGDPESAVEAAFAAIKTASEVIDMRNHSGAHARMGATDVCPFIPVSGMTMEDCAELARKLGERVAKELGIPIYLYEAAATREERRNLANVRAGEYEGLEQKLKDPEWAPDFGEAKFNPGAGATVIGARKFLIAYNVNLNTRDRKRAHDIALDIREAGRAKRDAQGEIVRHPDGKAIKVPGRLKETKAVGWYIDEYDQAQVSINLVDYEVTAPHQVFDVIEEEAQKRGLRVTGSELVGLIPLNALLMAGRHYLKKQGKSMGIPERMIVETAVQSLGLRDIATFDLDEKIIEYRLNRDNKGLVDLTVTGFANELSTDSPAPGGGSVAALCGSLSASLSSMVGNLTMGRKGQESVWEEMSELGAKAQELKDWYLSAVDRDTAAFNAVMAANRIRAKSDDEKAAKADAVKAANRLATTVPMEVLERTMELIRLAQKMAEFGNPNSLSDAGVAGLTARSCAEGAYYNVLINLGGLDDDAAWGKKQRTKAEANLAKCREKAEALAKFVERKLSS